MKNQTPIDWLIEELTKPQYAQNIPIIIEQAKEMEKRIICDAFEFGQKECANGFYNKLGIQYYNKNFNQ
jgi:hypothetical protein